MLTRQASEARRPGTELEADSREGEEVEVWKQTPTKVPEPFLRGPDATLAATEPRLAKTDLKNTR